MGARVFLTLLISYRNLKEIYASQSTFGKILGVSRQTISKYLDELEKAGFIKRISQGDGKTRIINLLPPVIKAVTACKEYVTQETIIKKEGVSVRSLSEGKELVEVFESEFGVCAKEGEAKKWAECFAELIENGSSYVRLVLITD